MDVRNIESAYSCPKSLLANGARPKEELDRILSSSLAVPRDVLCLNYRNKDQSYHLLVAKVTLIERLSVNLLLYFNKVNPEW